jgi:hypothetical protein
MEYRFSLTPRLIALALFSGVALMVLLFALGYQVGQSVAERPAPAAVSQQVSGKIDAGAAAASTAVTGAAAPLTTRAAAIRKAGQ